MEFRVEFSNAKTRFGFGNLKKKKPNFSQKCSLFFFLVSPRFLFSLLLNTFQIVVLFIHGTEETYNKRLTENEKKKN